jgi:hypothetical protein
VIKHVLGLFRKDDIKNKKRAINAELESICDDLLTIKLRLTAVGYEVQRMSLPTVPTETTLQRHLEFSVDDVTSMQGRLITIAKLLEKAGDKNDDN